MLPVLFRIPTPWGEIPLYSYGVMLGTSLLVGWYLIMNLAASPRSTAPLSTPAEELGRYRGLNRDLLANAFLLSVVFALAGARLAYILTNLHDFHSFSDLINTRKGGMVAYGSFLGGTLTSWLYLRSKGLPFLIWADVACTALCAGTGLTRIGCYLFGCDFGLRLGPDAPGLLQTLGTFPHWDLDGRTGAAAFVHHVNTEGLPLEATHSYPVHPTQLYESLVGFILLAWVLWLWPRRKFVGQMWLTAVLGYATWRFGVEFVRADPERGGALGVSSSQWVSLAVVPAAAWVYARTRKQAENGEQVLVVQDTALEPPPDGEAPTPLPEAPEPARASSGQARPGKKRKKGKRRR